MSLVVQKYGGSSLRSPAHIRRAAARIQALRLQGEDVVVVVSAMGRMTDHLVRLAKKTVKRPPQRELDMLLTAGERVSMALLAMTLDELGVPAISFTGSQSGIVTTSDHTDAKIIDIKAHRILTELEKKKVVIVAGFQGVSREKEITTLGRGGSDTTAVALAAALKADRCEVLTDVDGLFTLDPRLSSQSHLITECSYDEAIEFARLGAKMHARSLELAKKFKVTVHISSSATSNPGTVVGDKMESATIRGIATKSGFHFFRVKDELCNLYQKLGGRRNRVKFLHGAQHEWTFLCDAHCAEELRECLGDSLLEEQGEVATVSAVGEGIANAPHVAHAFAEVMSLRQVNALLFSSNSLSVTIAIPERYRADVARDLHERLVVDSDSEDKKKSPLERGLSMSEARPSV